MTSAVTPLKFKPGARVEKEDGTLLGSVCLFLKAPSTHKLYALTAAHVVGSSLAEAMDRIVRIRAYEGGEGVRTAQVKFATGLEWSIADAALLELVDDTVRADLSNAAPGATYPVEHVPALPRPGAPEFDARYDALQGTPVQFHGARSEPNAAKPGTLWQEREEFPLPRQVRWIGFKMKLRRLDSGGLFTSRQGRDALAILQAGKELLETGEDDDAYPVYAIHLDDILRDFASPDLSPAIPLEVLT